MGMREISPVGAQISARLLREALHHGRQRKSPARYNLRKGRISLPNHAYLATIGTAKRLPVFTSFDAARVAVKCLHDSNVKYHADTLAFVVMPDHVHWLFQLKEQGSLSETIRLYKAKVSFLLQQRIWQRGFHDHALRAEEDVQDIARYIVANPLRAGIVKNIGEYPHWDAIWL
jgi:REP element-mobilizing transposase RayT